MTSHNSCYSGQNKTDCLIYGLSFRYHEDIYGSPALRYAKKPSKDSFRECTLLTYDLILLSSDYSAVLSSWEAESVPLSGINSFVSLAQQGFFKGTTCHRLTTSPMLAVLQCGDPKGDGTGGPGYQFANEYPTDQYSANDPKLNEPVIYPRGTLAMANAGPNTNSSQFFMVYRDSKLPPQYTVFGTIQADGLTTLDKIAKAGVAGGGEDGKPATEVTITSVLLD